MVRILKESKRHKTDPGLEEIHHGACLDALEYKAAIKTYFEGNLFRWMRIEDLEQHGCLDLDFEVLRANLGYNDFETRFSRYPDQYLILFEQVAMELVNKQKDQDRKWMVQQQAREPGPRLVRRIRAKITNFQAKTLVGHLRSHCLNQFISLSGFVVDKQHMVSRVRQAYSCQKCLHQTVAIYNEHEYSGKTACPIPKCSNDECRASHRHLKPNFRSIQTRILHVCRIELLERTSDGDRTIDCEFVDELIDDSVKVGDHVRVNGIVMAKKTRINETRLGDSSPERENNYQLYILGNAVIQEEPISGFGPCPSLGLEQQMFEQLAYSFCPHVYGWELLKAGLLLLLLVGENSHLHTLLVGDPSIGKTLLLEFVARVSPRAVLARGESRLNKTKECESLPIFANEDVCIDSFGSWISCNRDVFVGLVDSQRLYRINSNGYSSRVVGVNFFCTANVQNGHYNHVDTMTKNTGIDEELLARFNMVFVMNEQPNEAVDMLVSEHILSVHSNTSVTKGEQSEGWVGSTLYETMKLKQVKGECIIDRDQIRSWIGHARKIEPVMTLEVMELVQNRYLEMTQNYGKRFPAIDMKMLATIVELVRSRTKCDLRTECTEADVNQVFEIVECSLQRQNGSEKKNAKRPTKQAEIQRFVKHCQANGKKIMTLEELKKTGTELKIDYPGYEFQSLIEILNENNVLLKMAGNVFRVV